MPLLMESLNWDGAVLSANGSTGLILGTKIRGFGQGSHRMPTMDRAAGGGASGISLPTPRVIDVDVWSNDHDELLELRAKMAARPLPTDVLPLSWRGLGWGDRELCVYARPVTENHDVDQEAPQGVVAGINCQWQADDPTVYELTPTTRTQSTATSLVSWEWENTGHGTPLPGLGGRAWTVEITAATTTVRPYVRVGSRRVTFRSVTLAPGQKLRIGPDRIPRVGSTVALGYSSSPPSLDAQWPILPAGEEVNFVIGAESGTFTAAGEFRGTW